MCEWQPELASEVRKVRDGAKDESRTHHAGVMFSATELEGVKAIAKNCGVGTSTFIRMCVEVAIDLWPYYNEFNDPNIRRLIRRVLDADDKTRRTLLAVLNVTVKKSGVEELAPAE